MPKTCLLEQASIAAAQNNWSSLNQYLQQILSKENQTANQASSSNPNHNRLLNWALDILYSGDFSDRWDVAKIFPYLGSAAIDPLIALLEDDTADTELRWFATRILGEFQQPEVVEALVQLLQNCDSEELNQMAASALANIGTLALEPLSQLLNHPENRLLAVQSLSQIRRSETVTELLKVVNDADPNVRAIALEALASFHDPQIIPILINALKDVAPTVRREAVIALGLRQQLRNEIGSVKLLRDRLWDFNLEVCRQAAIALSRLGTPEAAVALSEVLQSKATPTLLQTEVVRCLGWMETPEALESLQNFLSSTPAPEVSQEIINILGGIEKPLVACRAAEILIDFANSNHPQIQHPSLKSAIALSLGRLGDRRGFNLLIQLLTDSESSVRLHADAAIKLIMGNG